MNPIKHPGLQFSYTAYGRYGSAWNEKFSGSALNKLHALTRLGVKVVGFDGLRGLQAGLTPNGQWAAAPAETASIKAVEYLGPNRAYRFYMPAGVAAGSEAYTYTTGVLDAEFPATGYNTIIDEITEDDSAFLTTEEDQPIFIPDPLAVMPTRTLADFAGLWFVTLNSDIIPTRIRMKDGRDLLLNVDFWLQRDKLVWRQDPKLLFPVGQVAVVSGLRPSVNIHNYVWQTDELNHGGEWIAAYYGLANSVKYFERALAQACNFHVAPKADTIITSKSHYNGRLYERLNGGLLWLDYPHNTVENGTQYEAGEVLGTPVKLVTASNTQSEWWREAGVVSVHRGNTIPALPFAVTFPDFPVFTDAVAQTGDNIHARLHLPATSDEDLAKYWHAVMRSEKLSGYYLNTSVQLTSIDDKTYVWPLPLLFSSGIGSRMVVLQRTDFYNWSAERQARFVNFVTRARPSNSIIITVDA